MWGWVMRCNMEIQGGLLEKGRPVGEGTEKGNGI